MAIDEPEMVIADAMMQMCDGIHHTTKMMSLGKDKKIAYLELDQLKDDMGKQLTRLNRKDFLDRIEAAGATDGDMERVYGEYNSYAIAPDTGELFAWYNNDR